MRQNNITQAIQQAQDKNLRMLDLGGRINSQEGFETVDLINADIIADLNEKWPFENNSVGVIRASHIFEHLKDSIFTMNEAYRVRAPGGWLFIEVPSTAGAGAFQDPTHISFWNENSFLYYTDKEYAGYVPDFKGCFKKEYISTFFHSDIDKERNISVVQADLIAVKNINGKKGSLWDVTPDIAFGCMVNDKKRLDLILKNSHIGNAQCFTIFDPESATKGLNILLNVIEKSGASIGILTHQDMYYREHWLPQVKEQIAKLPEDWVIAGIVGKDEEGTLCGRFHDMSTPLWIVSEHEFPVKCSCIDECTIIVNMKSGFRFDEELEGFDLYGTYACLRANEMGSAWIIDSWAEHYCSRFWGEWEPGEVFMKMWKWFYNRFPGKMLESTVLVGENK